jgi:hypothetical protein
MAESRAMTADPVHLGGGHRLVAFPADLVGVGLGVGFHGALDSVGHHGTIKEEAATGEATGSRVWCSRPPAIRKLVSRLSARGRQPATLVPPPLPG